MGAHTSLRLMPLMSLESPAVGRESIPIDVGVVLGGRFELEALHGEDAFGSTFRAHDRKSGKAVSIRLLKDGDACAVDDARDHIKAAAQRKHRNVAAIYALGSHPGGERFLAQEWVQGTKLSDFVAERIAEGETISLRAAYNLAAHVCKALNALHPDEFYGALRPSVVWVSKAGRVKITDAGIGRAFVESQQWRKLPASEQGFLAPEVRNGGEITARADIYGLGALLYVMLTGRCPGENPTAPSKLHSEANPAVDSLIMRCLARNSEERFSSAVEVIEAMLPLVQDAPDGDLELNLHLEVDVDIAVSLAPPPPGATNGHAQAPRLGAAGARTASAVRGSAMQPPDLDALVEKLTKNDSPKWMAAKDGMDHGPFTTRELIKMIVEGEVLPSHSLFHMGKNERKTVAEHQEFSPFVAQYELRKAEKDYHVAIERSKEVEKRSTRFKVLVFAAGLAAIGIVAAGYIVSRQQASKVEAEGDVDLASAYGDGQVRITGTASLLKAEKTNSAKPRKSGGGSSGGRKGGTGFMSYQAAMNQAVEMNMGKAGGERQLNPADVAGTMNRNLNTLFTCVTEERRAGGKVGSVRIDLAIQGTGRVMGATITGGGSSFQRCIAGKVRRIKFPSFPAPRMGARYSFDTN